MCIRTTRLNSFKLEGIGQSMSMSAVFWSVIVRFCIFSRPSNASFTHAHSAAVDSVHSIMRTFTSVHFYDKMKMTETINQHFNNNFLLLRELTDGPRKSPRRLLESGIFVVISAATNQQCRSTEGVIKNDSVNFKLATYCSCSSSYIFVYTAYFY